MYLENPEGTRVIIDSMNMGYVSDSTKTRTRNLFHSFDRLICLTLGPSRAFFVDSHWRVGFPGLSSTRLSASLFSAMKNKNK